VIVGGGVSGVCQAAARIYNRAARRGPGRGVRPSRAAQQARGRGEATLRAGAIRVGVPWRVEVLEGVEPRIYETRWVPSARFPLRAGHGTRTGDSARIRCPPLLAGFLVRQVRCCMRRAARSAAPLHLPRSSALVLLAPSSAMSTARTFIAFSFLFFYLSPPPSVCAEWSRRDPDLALLSC